MSVFGIFSVSQLIGLIRWRSVDIEHFGSSGAADCVFSREGSGQFRLP